MDLTLTCKNCGKQATRSPDAYIEGLPVRVWWTRRNELCKDCHDDPNRIVSIEELARIFNGVFLPRGNYVEDVEPIRRGTLKQGPML